MEAGYINEWQLKHSWSFSSKKGTITKEEVIGKLEEKGRKD